MTRQAVSERPVETPTPVRGMVLACVEATKPGITRLVTITALVGLLLAGLGRDELDFADWFRLLSAVILGTALSAGGANALNMWYESDRDALMRRTATRPIPSARLTPGFVLCYGLALISAGTAVLAILVGVIPALVALVCAASYILLYTPLKPITVWNTLIGALPGALPVMIGTAAVSTEHGFRALADPVGLALFAIMMVWQIPHFLAIAWMCKADYERGGFRMLPAIDPTGRLTAGIIVGTSVLLIPVCASIAFIIPDLLSWPTIAASVFLGLVLVALGMRVALQPSERTARAAFIGSIIHLPVLLTVMVAEALLRTAF